MAPLGRVADRRIHRRRVAIIGHTWWLLWTCTAIIVLAIPAGNVVGIMDDTAGGDSTPAAAHDPSQD